MLIKRLGRAAAWLTVAILAGATTLGAAVLVILGDRREWAAALGGFSVLLWPALLLVALAPWWALVAVALQRERVRNGRR